MDSNGKHINGYEIAGGNSGDKPEADQAHAAVLLKVRA